ncbi:MAG: HDIG domain-containing metalloprotein [Myxococcota bacterium]|nr:HDIG domain-containing metalloprotein [Myxococcota bacterium]
MSIILTSGLFGLGLVTGGFLYQRTLSRRLETLRLSQADLDAQCAQERQSISAQAETRMTQERERLEARLAEERTLLQSQYEQAHKSNERRAARIEERQQAHRALNERLHDIGGQVASCEEKLQQTHEAISQTESAAHALLEERATTTEHNLCEQLTTELSDDKKVWFARQARRQSELLQQNAEIRAKRLIKGTIERYSGVGHLERLQNQIEVPNARAFAALADTEHISHKTLTELIGFELNFIPEKKNMLLVQGDDPLAREIARRVLRQLANRSITAPNKIRAISQRTQEEVQREVQNAGRKATRIFGMKNVHNEVSELVGRLKFRLSYSQNQLKHAIEVAYLSGLLAEELGLNIAHAQRGGLLHDIGKALTHEREGSHAVLGAEVARRCGEHEVVANAIGSHHHDEPMATPIATIVTAADALSGARPGARRETATLFLERVQQIEEIARRGDGVDRIEIMNGGREVRVLVSGQQLGAESPEQKGSKAYVADDELHPIAETIAQDIEDEVTYPGQVRVTVIRESRATSIAR